MRWTLALLLCANGASAQWTGYELAWSGPMRVHAGRTATMRGVAYRVRGLAELVPSGLPIEAHFATEDGAVVGPSVDLTTEASGAFVIDVPIPENAPVNGQLVVNVGGDDARELVSAVSVSSPYDVTFVSDRRLYEGGETVHLWALVREARSGRIATGVATTVHVAGALAEITREVRTSEAGVVHVEIPVPERAPEGIVYAVLRIGAIDAARTDFSIGTRTWERVAAEIEIEPEEVAPSAPAIVHVRVTTPSGAPMMGASVRATIDEAVYDATTDADGRADVEVRAPAYLEHETGIVPVQVEIAHPAHGSLVRSAYLRLAVPLALEVELVPRHGALIPEVSDVLYARVHDAAGDPPPAGTEITLRGAAIVGGSATARTDENGLAEVAVRLPLGSAASHDGSLATTVIAEVAGPLTRIARQSIAVLAPPEVVPTVADPLLEPGARVEIALARRSAASARPIVVEVLEGDTIVALERVAARTDRVAIALPPDRIGLFLVRARAVHEADSTEGTGAHDALIVRPAQPDFLRLTPERTRYTVGETASLHLHTIPNAPRTFAALLVRDLSAHGGEAPFRRSFLDGAFERALIEPSGPSPERLLRAALAASIAADAEPRRAAPVVDELGIPPEETGVSESSFERGVLRDPWPLARELVRRGAGPAMLALEERLAEALSSGGLDDLTEGRGAARRFRDEPIDELETLGGEPAAPSLLTRADPSFSYENVARRVARARLVRLLVALSHHLDPGEDASPADRQMALEPPARWLPRMVERGTIAASDLEDPWGGQFTLRETRTPLVIVSPRATALELVSPGPDGRAGTRDDVRDPFARAVPAGTPYAVASGEDQLMRRLAMLSPVERTLEAIAEAYLRANAEVSEEEIGDAVSARVSEGTIGLGNLGTIGHGAGGGGGSGYGSGSGSLGGRSARAPTIRTGSASVSGLARVVRERFPPTLLFRPSFEVDASGTTAISLPLADAVTTYVVEVIAWRADGWIWWTDARIEVDREIVADAPVPDVAHAGDRVELPLRISNRGAQARELLVRLMPEPALGIEGSEPVRVNVGPGEAEVAPVDITPRTIGEGTLVVAVTTLDGEAVDAVRRPMRVVRGARRVHAEREILAAGDAALELDVPAGADPRRGRVQIAVGTGWLPVPRNQPFAAWESGGPIERESIRAGTPELGFALGAAYNDERYEDERLARVLTNLTTSLERRRDRGGAEHVRMTAYVLLGLSPIARAEHRDLPEARALLERLGRDVSADAVALSEDPESWAIAAAALAWSARGDEHRDRVAELVRRLGRHRIAVGDDRWVATEGDAVRSTVLLAMAELALGRRSEAFALLSTVARWHRLGHPLSDEVAALARAATARLLAGAPPSSATVTIDGRRRAVRLEEQTAEIDAPELARPGRHVVRVHAEGEAPVVVRADADFGVPWTVRPIAAGPFALRYEGEVGARDAISEMELVVANRAPRMIAAPIVEIELPTGSELTEQDRARMQAFVASITRGEGVLTLRLRPMRPGNEVRIPLPLRWSLAGDLVGLGTSAYAEDRPDAVTIVAPRTLRIRGAR